MLRIEQELRNRGLTHAEMSRRTGIHTSTISRLVGGKVYPYPGWKRRIGDALDIDGDDLFREVGTQAITSVTIASPGERGGG